MELCLHCKRTILHSRDNGKGFDPAMMDDQENFGLSGLKSRVNFLEGDLTLTTAPGKGVHYRLVVPLN